MWTYKKFDELTTAELYQLLKLRVDVFVVEQNCPYPELDGMDQDALHIQYIQDEELLAYCRILPPGKYEQPSIGRVIVRADQRGTGLANELMTQSVAKSQELYSGQMVRLCAQAHLQNFYGRFQFETISEEFLEDGIPHVYMLKK